MKNQPVDAVSEKARAAAKDRARKEVLHSLDKRLREKDKSDVAKK
jgi:hypothetical protein